MGPHARGFTLIELMIVIAIIAVVAAIALPNLLSSRINANETAAIGTLRKLISSQALFQKRALCDEDGDGIGEMGTFAEMSGAVNVRGTSIALQPAVLSSAFRTLNADGEVASAGYQFRMYLPDANGRGLGEEPGGGPPAGIEPDFAETTWCCYAWPSSFEHSGARTFMANQSGDLLFTSTRDYSGPGGGPEPGSAFRVGGPADSITGLLAAAVTGRDGNVWRSVGN